MVVLASSDVVGGLGDVGLLIHDHEVSPPEDLQVQEEPLGGGTAVLQGHAIEAGLRASMWPYRLERAERAWWQRGGSPGACD